MELGEPGRLAPERPSDQSDAEVAAESALEQMWGSLVRVVRKWVRRAHDAEDLASEALTRAITCLGPMAPWRRLWLFAVRTARRLVLDNWRARLRERILARDLATLLDAAQQGRHAEWIDFLDCFNRRLRAPDRDVVQMLLAGATIEQIALARGITGRAMRLCCARITTATTAGKDT